MLCQPRVQSETRILTKSRMGMSGIGWNYLDQVA
jgi:hypothetical protein